MGDFKNEFSYSNSKDRLAGKCLRKLYYKHYLSWGGWESDAPERTREAYVQKFATNRFMWAGSLLHSTAAWALDFARAEGGWASLQPDDSRENLCRMLDSNVQTEITQGLMSNSNGDYLKDPKRKMQLMELSLGQSFNEDGFREKVSGFIRNLCSSAKTWSCGDNLFIRALRNASRIIDVEEIRAIVISDTPVWVVTDLVMDAKAPNSAVIVDWKTGNPKAEDVEQVRLYSLVSRATGWTETSAMLVYLKTSPVQVKTIPVAPKHDKVHVAIKVNVFKQKMRGILVDGDLERNEPIPQLFVPTKDIYECRLCPFQRLCEKDGTRPS